MTPRAILLPGRNCWTADAAVEASGLLIDARAYYRAFYQAARNARRYLLLAGWRFNSDVRLLRGPDVREADGEGELLPFLSRLCAERPELHVYVLAWDFSVNYALEWEGSQQQKFEAAGHGRIRFRFDGHHPVGGSHHQKLVVVDGQVAFVGGLDFCAGDWDDRSHRAYRADRADAGQEPHGPYHDLQAFVTGPAAAELADYFRQRWRRATGEELELPAPQGPAPVVQPTVALAGRRVALSENRAPTLTSTNATFQIRQLYLDAIAAADRLLYLENQYFSSQAVLEALLARMRAPGRPRLEIVMVLPKQLVSWVEAAAMEPARVTLLDSLSETARETGHRLGLYYTAAGAHDGREVPVLVHSKLLLVDDRFLTVGSANTSNRSMGLDSELNVAWEAATTADRELVRSIRRVRVSLLAEHSGLRGPEAWRQLSRRQGLVAFLDGLAAAGTHRLRPLTREAVLEDRGWLEHLARWGVAFDPARPVVEQTLHETLGPGPEPSTARQQPD